MLVTNSSSKNLAYNIYPDMEDSFRILVFIYEDISAEISIPRSFRRSASQEIKANWLSSNFNDSISQKFMNIGVFNFHESSGVSSMATRLPGVNQRELHPVTKRSDTLFHLIMDLNDNYKWSREQIADWIEALDNVPTFTVRAIDEEEFQYPTILASFKSFLPG